MRPRLPDSFDDIIRHLKTLQPQTVRQLLGLTKPTPDRIREVGTDKDSFKLLILSDIHSLFVDNSAFGAVLRVLAGNQFDEIVLNGDTLDFPYLSTYAKRIYDQDFPQLENYSEALEIEFVRDQILDPIYKLSRGAKIVFRLGNHDERITRPKAGKSIAEAILSVQRHFGTVKLEQMLSLPDFGIEYDPTAARKYFGCFSVLHGLSLAQNAPIKNIYQTFGAGSSGHTHRLQSRHIATRDAGVIQWIETGCLCESVLVPYLPTAIRANWSHGFGSVVFDLSEESPRVFAKTNPIVNGKTEFGGLIY